MKNLIKSLVLLIMGMFCFVSCSEDTPDNESYFTVKFNSMGGTEVKEQKVKPGEKAEKPADPEKDGVVFSGWFKSDKFEKEWIFENETVNSDITLYAKWIAPENSCTVVFESNGGTKINSKKVEKGSQLSDLPVPEKEGFEFEGWYTDAACTVKFELGTKIVEDITLFAKWKAESIDTLKKMLNELIAKAEGLNENDYYEEQFEDMKVVLERVKKVAADANATNEEIQKAYDDLKAVVDVLLPILTGENLFIEYDGHLLDDKYIVVNSSYNSQHTELYIDFETYNEYGLYTNEQKYVFNYEKDKLNSWLAESGSISEEDYMIVINNLKTNLPVGEEIDIKATSEVNSNVSKTVTLKIYSAENIKNKFIETVNSLPTVTLDNYQEVEKKMNIADELYYNLSEPYFQNQEVQSAYKKLQLLKDNDKYWYGCIAAQIDEKTCAFDYGVCQYNSNGNFPLGEITYQYTVDNGQLAKDQFKFLSENKFEYWYYSPEETNGKWRKEEAGEYKMVKAENGLQMIVIHTLESYYDNEEMSRSASPVKHILHKRNR